MQQTHTYPVVGMTCATCALTVKKTLRRQDGVVQAEVNLSDNTATVVFDDATCSPQDLQKAVHDIGYKLIISEKRFGKTETQEQQHLKSMQRRTIVAFLLFIPMMCLGMWGMNLIWTPWILWIMATPFVFVLGSAFFVNACRQLWHRQLGMDALVAISTGVAYIYSTLNLFFPAPEGTGFWFESTAGIVTFILMGRWLEARAKRDTNSAVRALMKLPPETVMKEVGGKFVAISIEEIREGDIIRTEKGERIATDGIVTAGTAMIDESMLTGEPAWVKKAMGDKVFAGTECKEGSITIRTERTGDATELGNIIRLVRQAGKTAPIQQMAERVAGIFVPTVIILSLITLVSWGLFSKEGDWYTGLRCMITVLIIACPCSLGLATPTAITVALSRALQGGVLVKDADSFEAMVKTTDILLDKTGTLTEGGFDGRFDHDQQRDRLKESSAEAVKMFKNMGLTVWLLSGDKPWRTEETAKATGIDHWQAEMTPQGKHNMVQRLKNEGKSVCMIGDGINDSAALALADMSLAMGQGSDVAMQTAKAVLMHTDLRAAASFVTLSRKTVTTIRQNLFWAFFYNIIAIPLAATGMVSPVTGALCMALSSVCVVMNSLRLRTFKTSYTTTQKSVTTQNTTSKTTNTHPMKPIYSYKVEGMMCQNCRRHVERALNAMPGIESAVVTLETAQADITFTNQPLATGDIQTFLTEEAGDYTIISL